MTIQKSDELNELFSALSKLQGKIEPTKKDKSGYLNRYKYVELSQYIEVSKDLLEENGLCVLQFPGTIEIVEITREIEDKKNISVIINTIKIPKQKITTFIGHSSGQFISETTEILVEKMAGNSWGQATGSAISFSRRYAYAGGLCMTQEDDDNQIRKNDTNRNQAQQDPLITQLMNLIKLSGCNVEDFTKFYNISSKDIVSVKRSIDNFDELLINYRENPKIEKQTEIQNS